MVICAFVSCSKRSDRESDKDVSFYRIPAIRNDRSPREQELTKRRRAGFVAAICRKDLDLNALHKYRVCSRHFISGAPVADVFDETNPDWLPTLNLGHKESCSCSFCRPATTERYDRAQRRSNEQRIRESVFLRAAELILQETVDSTVEDEVTEILEEIELVDHSSLTVVEHFVAEFVDSCLKQIIEEEMHCEVLRVAKESCNCSVEIKALQEELAACHSRINELLLQLKESSQPFGSEETLNSDERVLNLTGLPNNKSNISTCCNYSASRGKRKAVSVSTVHLYLNETEIRPLIVNFMFQIPRPHCSAIPPKNSHYYDVMPLFLVPKTIVIFSCELCVIVMSSSIVNVIVFCKSTNRTLFPWQIAKIHPPSATFRSFFAEVISTKMAPRPDGTVGSISEVFVGKRKDLLDLVDPDLQIIEVTPTFGHFIKYYVRDRPASECTVTTTTTTVYSQLNGQCRNAFQIMMAAQTELCSKQLPDVNPNPRNGKERLRNDILSFLAAKGYKWKNSSELEKYSESFLQSTSNVLWYIDGHHDCLKRQGFSVPTVFAKFSNYNRPELSKHRKREFANLDKSTLQSLSSHLFSCLQHEYWDRQNWKILKHDTVLLAQSISGYAEYLDQSNKRSKNVHSSLVPVHEISDNMSITFLPIVVSRPPLLADLVSKLDVASDFEYISVDEFCHIDARKRYEYIQTIKQGLPFKTILFTYKHGNNIGNLNFVWKIPEQSLADSLKVIEQVKSKIPRYHTRMMKKYMFQRFGRLMPSVKPAVMRCIYRELSGMY